PHPLRKFPEAHHHKSQVCASKRFRFRRTRNEIPGETPTHPFLPPIKSKTRAYAIHSAGYLNPLLIGTDIHLTGPEYAYTHRLAFPRTNRESIRLQIIITTTTSKPTCSPYHGTRRTPEHRSYDDPSFHKDSQAIQAF